MTHELDVQCKPEPPFDPALRDETSYARIVFLALRELCDKGVPVFNLGLELQNSIRRTTEARQHVRDRLIKILRPEGFQHLYLLLHKIPEEFEDVFPVVRPDDWLVKSIGRLSDREQLIASPIAESLSCWHDLVSKLQLDDPHLLLRLVRGARLVGGAEPEHEAERDVIGFLAKHRNDVYTSAMLFCDGLIRRCDLTCALISNPDASQMGTEAYIEALSLFGLCGIDHTLRPPDFAAGILHYYFARRLGDNDEIACAWASLRYGLNGHGPLFTYALRQYSRRPDCVREDAAIAFCDQFERVMSDLSVEALLAPSIAVKYALTAAQRAGNKTIPRMRKEPEFVEVKEMPSSALSEEIRSRIAPLLPPEVPKKKGGRPVVPALQVMEAILYALRNDCPWVKVPRNLGSHTTINNRFRLWYEGGVFERLDRAGILREVDLDMDAIRSRMQRTMRLIPASE